MTQSLRSIVDDWPQPYAAPLAEILRLEAEHAAHLAAEGLSWERYPPDTALVLAVADGVLLDAEREAGRG